MTLREADTVETLSGHDQKKTAGRRSHLEIRMDILTCIMDGAGGPTQIMYRANLSWVPCCDELRSLVMMGLVDEVFYGSRKRYTLTSRGLEVIRAYERIIREVESR